MKTLKHFLSNITSDAAWQRFFPFLLLFAIILLTTTVASADILDRRPPVGTVPNPGTQQQELANITFPAPYNVFEFVVTCGACHSGTVDQAAGHFGNWAGTSMASAARDPYFRANQIGVNNLVAGLTGEDGAGNMCMRCHSPNGWLSGRFDPNLAGDPQGTTMIHSILASTDDEGVLCEACHRSMGGVTYKDPAINPMDQVWNMMAGISDWPHQGTAFVDQAGDPTIATGNPYGDTTLQFNDGMTYEGKYSGSIDLYFSDLPMVDPVTGEVTPYTGQTYGVYPTGWTGPKTPVPAGMPQFNTAGQEIAYGPTGTVIHFEAPIGPPFSFDPATGSITYDYMAQAVSLEHPTVGARSDQLYPKPMPEANAFITTSEFCGSCHELTVPVLNHGMPEQRTYTEWKYSDFGTSNTRCQDCHMPTMQHEYADDIPQSLNPDPVLAGWFPYGKDRSAQGGTAFHKFAGANRDLPEAMKILYPEVDLEVIGAETGVDTRIFPGMLSDRSPMWDRAQRNTDITLQDAIDAEILSMAYDTTLGRWVAQVKVTNNAGHRAPSGYPDGRRFWLELKVADATGIIYQSGAYDAATATLETAPGVPFARALENVIDASSNAVMVYERVTCTDDPATGACVPSPSLLNNKILFDNRPLAQGFDYAQLRDAGVKFWNYDPATMQPYEDMDRYPNGQNFDVVTYIFDAPADAALAARAEVYWQTHTREFVEHLKDQDTSTVRPEGPPSIYDPNYPLAPNYLSNQIGLAGMTDMDGVPLRDNWGGIAYASWLLTGQGAPFLVAADDTTALALPDAPVLNTAVTPDPFTVDLSWSAVDGADGYLVWMRYGVSDATAAWDRHAVVMAPGTTLTTTALNVGKTYGIKVQAFNGAGYSLDSNIITFATATDTPLTPEALRFVGSNSVTITMSFFDMADNETEFVIQRQDVPVVGPFQDIATMAGNGAATGGISFTDGSTKDLVYVAGYVAPQKGFCYNYQVAARNASGTSAFSLPAQGCAKGAPAAPVLDSVTAVTGRQVNLTWTPAGTVNIDGFIIERSTNNLTWPTSFTVADPLAVSFSDTTVLPGIIYYYRVSAYNAFGTSAPSNVMSVATPADFVAAPSGLTATPSLPSPLPPTVALSWTNNAPNATGFLIERALDNAGAPGTWAILVQTSTTATSYTDTTVAPKETYWYRVTAVSGTSRSLPSNEAMAVTPGQTPEAPANLVRVSVTKNSIAMAWQDKSTNELGFYVERLNGTTWTRIATLPANTTSYTATGLSSKTTYSFRVQAYNADGVSGFTNVLQVKTK